MSSDEQQSIKQEAYSEALHYLDNAREFLQKAGKEDHFYKDRKYVKNACGTAYNGVLIALDTYLSLKGIKRTRGRKSIEYYSEQVARFDKKMVRQVNNAYKILHLSGFYDGVLDVRVIKAGMDEAGEIINRIKP
jgi:tRNA G37 N-methylase TrmD